MKSIHSIVQPHKEARMTSAEKKAVWEKISMRVFDDNVRNSLRYRLYQWGTLITWSSERRVLALGALATFVVLSGSISSFAKGALPGELLYPVKTSNEKIQILFAFTPEEKASLESFFATKRLEEAEQLAIKNRLSPELEARANRSFTEHVEKMGKHLATLEEHDQFGTAAQVGVAFQARIAAHTIVLKDLQDNSKNKNVENGDVNAYIFSRLEDAASSSVIATAVITEVALAKLISPSAAADYQTKSALRDVSRERAKEYVITLREQVGLPPIPEATSSEVIPLQTPPRATSTDQRTNSSKDH